MVQGRSSWESAVVRSEDLPEGADQCEECRGRGMNFNRETLELNTCKECEGLGFEILNMDEELRALIGDGK